MAQKYYDIGLVPETTELEERLILPYNELNYCLNGLLMNRITLLIAPTNSGKSCFSSSIIKSAINQGYNCFGFFGEDGGAEARDRIFRQHLEFDKENFIPLVLGAICKSSNSIENKIGLGLPIKQYNKGI